MELPIKQPPILVIAEIENQAILLKLTMSILAFLDDLASENGDVFTIIEISPDKKFMLSEEGAILHSTNVKKALDSGLLEQSGDDDEILTLVKGRQFISQMGDEDITFFTDKDASAPVFKSQQAEPAKPARKK